ncbi:MAG TPA: TonB-dependent receptor plug domain-containing protein, partial [Bradyrhizobium sp.]|nr:TonB-dependent receptor plug domain-containing protein [Bradyrhizobium sp.]
MSGRYLLIVSISVCPFACNESACAQDAPAVQALPPIVVTGTKPSVKRGRNESATRVSRALPKLVVVSVSPVPGAEIDREKVPSNVQTVTAADLDHAKTPSLLDGMVQSFPFVSLSDQSGNAFQRSLDYRGFTASPVPGTVQGLAVYQNGTRINEAFG